MENITNVRYGAMPDNSGEIRPFRMYYIQNGSEKNWDLALVKDGVAVIIYNKTTDKLIFVKQFRPVAYFDAIKKLGWKRNVDIDMTKYPAKLGVTLELCSRLVDTDTPVKLIVQEEMEKVCGYKVAWNRIEEVLSYRMDVGASGSEELLFYCEVTNDDKVTLEKNDKITEVVELSVEESKEIATASSSSQCPPTSMLGVLWFLRNKASR